MNSFKIIIMMAFLCLINTAILAQDLLLTGKITDTNNEPLPGAIIMVADKGTTTDLSGEYALKINEGEHRVYISYVGYETIEKTLDLSAENSTINFQLKEGFLQLQDITVSADPVAYVQKLTDYDLRLRPMKSSQEVLRLIPGLFIAQHAGGGKAEQIFLRGFDIDHGTDITLSVDGMPVNMVSHAHGQGYSDLHFVIPETIEKVEFNKGPYYASVGNFNTAGYAAFNTIADLDKNLIKLEGGSYGTLRNVNMINLLNRQSSSDLIFASEVYLTDGYFDSQQDFHRLNLFTKYSNHWNNNHLDVSLSHFRSQWSASGQIPLRAVESGMISRFGAIDDTEGGNTGRKNINLRWTKTLNPGTRIAQQAYFSQYDFELISNFTFFLNDPENGDQIRQQEDRKIYGYNGSYTTNYDLAGLTTTTEIGGGLRYDDINNIQLNHTLNRETILDRLAYGDTDELNTYSFVTQTVDLTTDLSVNAALRFDYFSFRYNDKLLNTTSTENAAIFSPKMAVHYQLNRNTVLFAKAGIGFHSNDTRVVVAQNGQDILPKAYGLDMGAMLKPTPKLAINTALWYLDLEQEFVYVGDEGIVEPGGRTIRRGIDLTMKYQALDWLHFDADINFTDPRSVEEEEGLDNIPLAPTMTSTGGVTINHKNGLNGSLRYRYLGDRPANEDYSVVADGYFILDARLNYTKARFDLGITIENLLNSNWREAQFETESRLWDENEPVSEIHFTPGSPVSVRVSLGWFF